MNLPTLVAKSGDEPAMVKAEKDWAKILISDASGSSSVLYAAQSGANTSLFTLPPVPPTGVFDIRFSTQSQAEVLSAESKDITISGAVYPVTLTADGVALRIKDKATGGKIVNQTLRSGESVQITNAGVNAIEVSSLESPLSFELLQNYPNPFNPSTTIKFGLPEKSNLTLTVYNQLGEKVAVLLTGAFEAGYHNVEWNASALTSGIYFYELKSEKFSSIKKLILMK
jgi:hypothetical protein